MHEHENRLTLFSILVITLFAIVGARLFYLQILSDADPIDAEASQNDTISKRGDIFFQDKDKNVFPVAITEEGFLLYIEPKNIKNSEETYEVLNTLIQIPREKYEEAVGKKDDPYEPIINFITFEDAEKIRQASITGVGLEPALRRIYPSAHLASQTIGFVQRQKEKMEGTYGIERFYDAHLSKKNIVSKADGVLEFFEKLFRRPLRGGTDLIATIDFNVQLVAEKILEKLHTKWQSDESGILIMDPQNGAIIAIAAIPNFNPNAYQEIKDLSLFLNPMAEKRFEMGSIFKPITIAAALDAGVITPDTTYVDLGRVTVGNAIIENYDGKARGKRTIAQILEESLNTGAVFVQQKLGKEKFKEYFERFGFNTRSNIDLPGEIKNDVKNLDTGKDVEYATASFGQGIAVTPVSLISALAALANGGTLVTPHVAERLADPYENSVVVQAAVRERVISPETSETITRMLVQVVDEKLAGGQVKMNHYTVAAKTGTAQIANENTKGYSDEFLHTFFGYAPAFNSRFIVFLYTEKPRGARYASETLSGSFKEILEFLINYYTIMPDR